MTTRTARALRFIVSAIAALLVVAAVARCNGSAPTPDAATGTVLITGSNRGIGLALAREYAGRGWTVIATARRPGEAAELQALAAASPNVRIEQLDVTSDADIAALRAALGDLPIDVLLNNAGSNAGGRGQKFGELDYAVLDELVHVNVAAPLKLAETFLPNVLASRQKKIVVLSSIQASITKTAGGSYFYRASKVALNMVMRTLAREREDEGLIIGILSPGFVATDMTRGADAPLTPEQSAHALALVVDGLTPAQSGDFIEYDGKSLPW